MTQHNLPPAQRFWSKVLKTGISADACWLWQDSCPEASGGYGQFTYTSSPHTYVRVPSHRYAWELAKGPIPADKQLVRKCINKHCVRPEHWKLTKRSEVQKTAVVSKRVYGVRWRNEITSELANAIREDPDSGRGASSRIARKLGLRFQVVNNIRHGKTHPPRKLDS